MLQYKYVEWFRYIQYTKRIALDYTDGNIFLVRYGVTRAIVSIPVKLIKSAFSLRQP